MTQSLAPFDPFADLSTLRRDLFDNGFFRALHGGGLPITDIYTEDGKVLVVEAHLPNFTEEDIAVHVDDGQLIIQAERHETDNDKRKKYILRETSSSFYRAVALPAQAQEARIDATFTDGTLKVSIPLGEAVKSRKISIAT